MGIVPWIRVSAGKKTRDRSGGSAPAVGPVSSAVDRHDPGQWLASQQLIEFARGNAKESKLGPANAPLLVVCEIVTITPGSVPLNLEETKLFDLMMRAINLDRTHSQLCAISPSSSNSADASINQTVSQLCGAQTAAVLFFCRGQNISDQTTIRQQLHTPHLPPLPLWCVAHPSDLMARPQLKRSAWESLKAIKATLGSE